MTDTQTLHDLADLVTASLGEAVTDCVVTFDELTVHARRSEIVKVISFLRDDPSCRFSTLIDICGVDYPARAERFEVVYHMLSMHQNERIRVKVNASEDTAVPSLVSIFPVANWFEREAFDMYGIIFEGHPDMRRILTDYGFHGHPLRKDFPLTGFVETRYDEERKRVVYEPVKLTQEFRDFDFMSPWEGAKYILPGDEKAEGKS